MSRSIKNLIDHFPLILLAGGKSSRMGVAKGLLAYGGHPWLLEQLHNFYKCGGRRAIVVLGYRHQEYLDEIAWLQEALVRPFGYNGLVVSACINPLPEFGPFSSIQCGVQELFIVDSVSGAFIMPIDVPSPGVSVWRTIAEAHTEQTAVTMPQYEGRGGHPVLLSAAFLDQLMAESLDSADARLDRQIQKLEPELIQRVKVDDPLIRMNINTPERWQHFLSEWK